MDKGQPDESDEEYINIENLINEKHKIYQLQLNNDVLLLKHVGNTNEDIITDMIIKENFGENKNLSLYSCLYNKADITSDKVLPIIKLIKDSDIYSICIKLNNTDIVDDIIINNFTVYYVYPLDNNKYEYIEIEKNINPNNIIEKLFEHIINRETLWKLK